MNKIFSLFLFLCVSITSLGQRTYDTVMKIGDTLYRATLTPTAVDTTILPAESSNSILRGIMIDDTKSVIRPMEFPQGILYNEEVSYTTEYKRSIENGFPHIVSETRTTIVSSYIFDQFMVSGLILVACFGIVLGLPLLPIGLRGLTNVFFLLIFFTILVNEKSSSENMHRLVAAALTFIIMQMLAYFVSKLFKKKKATDQQLTAELQ